MSNRSYKEPFIVIRGPMYDRAWDASHYPPIFKKKYHSIYYKYCSEDCNYVREEQEVSHRFYTFENWRIHKNYDYIQIFINHSNTFPLYIPTMFINGKDIHIIRLKYRMIFKALIRFSALLSRARRIISWRKSKIGIIFQRPHYAEINHLIISCI